MKEKYAKYIPMGGDDAAETRSMSLSDIMHTTGSNPSEIRVNWLRFMGHYPTWFVIPVILIVVVAVLGLWSSLWYLLALIVPLGMLALYTRNCNVAYGCGTTNPAVVISVRPFMIAAYANMTMGEGFVPAIKIERPRNPYGMVEIAERVPTAACYNPSPDKNANHWSDFHPYLLASATTDESEIERAMTLIDDVEWRYLQEGLKQVPTPYKPGIYFVKLQEEAKPFHENGYI